MGQITRAFALTGDAKPYRLHRDLYSRLYDALRASQVSQGDIASIWADPYLETVRSWERVASERRLRLKGEYPEMEAVASAYHKLAAQYRPASSLPDTISSEGLEDCSLDFALCFCSGVGSFLKQVGKEAFEKFATRSVAKTLIANEGALSKLAKWQRSERRAADLLGKEARPQVSFMNGKEVKYGTTDSVRPDFIKKKVAYEVKNYDLAKNASGLVKKVAEQVQKRVLHLPKGFKQGVLIDITEQKVTKAAFDKIVQKIVKRCNGILDKKDIVAMGDFVG